MECIDYDHLKKSYLPTYTRYWDDQSKVPFLYNASTGIWISYDDLQSIGLLKTIISNARKPRRSDVLGNE